ncbi:Bcr/CflA family multidrug efflux transporter [Pasteurellaceae bacterium Macca]|nr:Bcr/CflA family multidrug efflux transporter [Pasteurellaceae bacterium Macca]
MSSVRTRAIFTLIIGMLSMLPPLAIDMYLPSFLVIAQDLAVSQEKVQTTLALFTAGFAVGPLFWGPIADSFGRKPIILIGMIGSALAAYQLTQVNTIESFYLWRLVQGFLAAAPGVAVGALMRDLFERNQFAKVLSTIMIITMVAPLLAPIVGGYMVKWFHWHSIFYFLTVMGMLCASLVMWRIPETLSNQNRAPLNLGKTLKNFGQLLSHKATLGYMLVGGATFAGMFCFLTSGSLIYIGLYDVSPEHFGYFFMLNMGVMITMTLINGRLVTKLGSEKMLRIGLGLQMLATVGLVLCAIFKPGLMPMAFFVAFFIGMNSTIVSNSSAAILDRYPQMAGTANALAGTMRFGFGSISGAILAHIPLTSERPMLLAMAFCGVMGSLAYYFLACRHQASN